MNPVLVVFKEKNIYIFSILFQLTEKCKRALTRIFKICDLDGDGVLDDYEVTMFQRKCFDSPLQLQVLNMQCIQG